MLSVCVGDLTSVCLNTTSEWKQGSLYPGQWSKKDVPVVRLAWNPGNFAPNVENISLLCRLVNKSYYIEQYNARGLNVLAN